MRPRPLFSHSTGSESFDVVPDGERLVFLMRGPLDSKGDGPLAFMTLDRAKAERLVESVLAHLNPKQVNPPITIPTLNDREYVLRGDTLVVGGQPMLRFEGEALAIMQLLMPTLDHPELGVSRKTLVSCVTTTSTNPMTRVSHIIREQIRPNLKGVRIDVPFPVSGDRNYRLRRMRG